MEAVEELTDIKDAMLSYKMTPDKWPCCKSVNSDVYFLFDDTRCLWRLREEINDLVNIQNETQNP